MKTDLAAGWYLRWKERVGRVAGRMAITFCHVSFLIFPWLAVPRVAAAQNLSDMPAVSSETGTKRSVTSSVDSEADFKALMQRVLTAWETLDPVNAAPFYAKEVNNVFYDITPLKHTGWAQYADGARKVIGGFASQRLTIGDDVRVHHDGSFVWATATWLVPVTWQGCNFVYRSLLRLRDSVRVDVECGFQVRVPENRLCSAQGLADFS